jgi:hypothetical protein
MISSTFFLLTAVSTSNVHAFIATDTASDNSPVNGYMYMYYAYYPVYAYIYVHTYIIYIMYE